MSDAFDAYFDQFQHTAFRYEGQHVYSVDAEAEQIDAWRHGQPRPERSVRTSEWLRRVAVTTAAGKDWTRVRIVDDPLPEYLRYELNGYIESQAAGEQILMVDRDRGRRHHPDFWLFDAGTVGAAALLMRYTETGEFEGFEPVTAGGDLAALNVARLVLCQNATPLNVWLAERRVHA